MLTYGVSDFTFVWNVDTVNLIPSWTGGAPVSWTISPMLPSGITFSNGHINGLATVTSPLTTYTVWANNSGGSTSTTFAMKIIDQTPSNISWESTSVAREQRRSTQPNWTEITSWEIEPTSHQVFHLQQVAIYKALRYNALRGKLTSFGLTIQEVHSPRHSIWPFTMSMQTGKT